MSFVLFSLFFCLPLLLRVVTTHNTPLQFSLSTMNNCALFMQRPVQTPVILIFYNRNKFWRKIRHTHSSAYPQRVLLRLWWNVICSWSFHHIIADQNVYNMYMIGQARLQYNTLPSFVFEVLTRFLNTMLYHVLCMYVGDCNDINLKSEDPIKK